MGLVEGSSRKPFEEGVVDWANSIVSTGGAAVKCSVRSRDSWDSYVALCRHGGLDLGIGREAAAEADGERIFWLVRIVGRVWAALDLYGQAVTRLSVTGPWEVSVALTKTAGGYLGGFGNGWAEYPDPNANPDSCFEPNLFYRRELDAWLTAAQMREIAFSVGAWIEDSWGMQCRRFLGQRGPLKGQFDHARYR